MLAHPEGGLGLITNTCSSFSMAGIFLTTTKKRSSRHLQVDSGLSNIESRSVSFVVDLGTMDSSVFQGVFLCSLLGDFYFMYVIKDGFDHIFPALEKACYQKNIERLGQIYNYPHGERLQKVREMLEKFGYKPLCDFMLSKKVEVAGLQEMDTVSVLNALFG